MKLRFTRKFRLKLDTGTTPTMSSTSYYRDLSSESPQPNISFRRWLNRKAEFYFRMLLLICIDQFYLANDNVYVLYIS